MIIGVVLAWAQLLAGVLDAVENWVLYRILMGATCTYLPRIAWWCAAVKFAIVVAGLVFLLRAVVLAAIARIWRPKGVT